MRSSLTESRQTIAESDPDIWCTVGIHPHEAAAEPAVDEARLSALAAHAKVIGIGECGLDYHYDMSPRDRQIVRLVCGEGFFPSEAVRQVCADYKHTIPARLREALDGLVEAMEAARRERGTVRVG